MKTIFWLSVTLLGLILLGSLYASIAQEPKQQSITQIIAHNMTVEAWKERNK